MSNQVFRSLVTDKKVKALKELENSRAGTNKTNTRIFVQNKLTIFFKKIFTTKISF